MGRCKNDGEMSKRFNKSKIDNFYKAHIYIQGARETWHADEPRNYYTVRPTECTPATI